MLQERPIVAAIHPSMIEELKIRKDILELETGRKTKGGLTCFSEMAAHELKLLRFSGDKLMEEIIKLKNPPIKKIVEKGTEELYVPYNIFKKLYISSSVLNRKKDNQKIILEIIKLKGMKKNEINFKY